MAENTARADTVDALVKRKLLVPIAEAANALGLSTRTLRRRELDGDLSIVRVGGYRYITKEELRRFVKALDKTARDGGPRRRRRAS